MTAKTAKRGEAEAETTAVSKKEDGGALAHPDYGDMSGQGFENQTTADMAIPFLGLIQKMSPQLDESDPAYIEGAKPGSLFNTITGDLYDGQSGVIVLPCATEHVFTEWVPRDKGGGFAGIHKLDSPVVAEAKKAGQFGRLTNPENGNDLVETFYMYAMLLDGVDAVDYVTPVVIAFTSTKIKVYRKIMTQLRTVKLSPQPPLFAYRLRVSSVKDKNKHGEFANFRVEPALGAPIDSLVPPKLDGETHPLLIAGSKLKKAVASGAARAAHESQADQPGGEEADIPF